MSTGKPWKLRVKKLFELHLDRMLCQCYVLRPWKCGWKVQYSLHLRAQRQRRQIWCRSAHCRRSDDCRKPHVTPLFEQGGHSFLGEYAVMLAAVLSLNALGVLTNVKRSGNMQKHSLAQAYVGVLWSSVELICSNPNSRFWIEWWTRSFWCHRWKWRVGCLNSSWEWSWNIVLRSYYLELPRQQAEKGAEQNVVQPHVPSCRASCRWVLFGK